MLGDLLVALHGDERTRLIGPIAGVPVEGPRRPAHSHGHTPRPALGESGLRLRGDEANHTDVRFIGHLRPPQRPARRPSVRQRPPRMPATRCRRPARPEWAWRPSPRRHRCRPVHNDRMRTAVLWTAAEAPETTVRQSAEPDDLRLSATALPSTVLPRRQRSADRSGTAPVLHSSSSAGVTTRSCATTAIRLPMSSADQVRLTASCRADSARADPGRQPATDERDDDQRRGPRQVPAVGEQRRHASRANAPDADDEQRDEPGSSDEDAAKEQALQDADEAPPPVNRRVRGQCRADLRTDCSRDVFGPRPDRSPDGVRPRPGQRRYPLVSHLGQRVVDLGLLGARMGRP